MTPSSTKKDPAAQDLSPEEKQAATNAKRAATRAANKASAGEAGADGKREPKKRGPKPGAKAAAAAAGKSTADDADEVEEDLDDIVIEEPDVVEDSDADPAKGAAGSGKGFVYSDADDDDAPVQQVMSAGATADPVKDYLKQIGKVALLNAEQEVDLALRIEAGLFAEEKINADDGSMEPKYKRELEFIIHDGKRAKNHLLEANLRLVVSLAKRYTGRGMLFLEQREAHGVGRNHGFRVLDEVAEFGVAVLAEGRVK